MTQHLSTPIAAFDGCRIPRFFPIDSRCRVDGAPYANATPDGRPTCTRAPSECLGLPHDWATLLLRNNNRGSCSATARRTDPHSESMTNRLPEFGPYRLTERSVRGWADRFDPLDLGKAQAGPEAGAGLGVGRRPAQICFFVKPRQSRARQWHRGYNCAPQSELTRFCISSNGNVLIFRIQLSRPQRP